MRRFVFAAAFAALLLSANLHLALAHASLTGASIKNGQTFSAGHTPRSIQAYFAEPLDPSKSWMAVFEGQGDHGLVTEKQKSIVNFKNPKEMTLALPRLGRGKYYLIWYTRSAADNHFAAGIVYFQVR